VVKGAVAQYISAHEARNPTKKATGNHLTIIL